MTIGGRANYMKNGILTISSISDSTGENPGNSRISGMLHWERRMEFFLFISTSLFITGVGFLFGLSLNLSLSTFPSIVELLLLTIGITAGIILLYGAIRVSECSATIILWIDKNVLETIPAIDRKLVSILQNTLPARSNPSTQDHRPASLRGFTVFSNFMRQPEAIAALERNSIPTMWLYYWAINFLLTSLSLLTVISFAMLVISGADASLRTTFGWLWSTCVIALGTSLCLRQILLQKIAKALSYFLQTCPRGALNLFSEVFR